jgi:hypothetical protein
VFRSFDLSISRRVAFVLALAALFCPACLPTLFGQSQSSTASVSGVITDPQGARVVGAMVTFASAEKGIIRTFKTDSSGSYSFSLLPPASYNMKVLATGFKTYEQGGVVLEVGQAGVLNAGLSVGNVDEVVQVTAEAPLLATDNANVGDQVTQKQMVDLPLNFRNSASLLFLEASNKSFLQGTQGGTVDTADQDQSLMAFGGQFMGQTGFLLDGTWNGMMAYNGLIYAASPDTVQEFKIQTNSFSAQYGMTDGNAVSVITKSGTNKFHGDVYEFIRNYALDANYYFTPGQKPHTRMNQFGATAGGPLYIPGIYRQKDRTFIFGAYEGLRLGAASAIKISTPTTAFAAGDLSALLGAQTGTDALGRPIYQGQLYNPFSSRQITVNGKTQFIRDPIPNNNIAAAGLLDTVAKNMVSYFPQPNATGANNFVASASVPTASNEMTIRVDHNLSQNARLFGRYSRKWESKVFSAPLYGASDPAGPGQTNPDNRYSLVFGYSQVLSSTLTGSVSLGFNRWVEGNISQGFPFKSSSLGLPSALDPISPFFPLVSIGSGQYLLGNANQSVSAFNAGTLGVDLVKVKGPHTLSFGYQSILSQANGGGLVHTTFNFTSAFTAGPDPNAATTGTGNAFGSYLVGAVSSGSTGTTVLPAISKHYYGWYLQDDWKAIKNLTLNLGLRYDIQFSPTIRHDNQAYFEPQQVNPISSLAGGGPYNGQLVYNSGGNRGLYGNSYTNFSPRVGFAYQVVPKVVLRGGFGIFFPSQYTGQATSPGYLQTTSLVSSLNGGINPSSTLRNPFPQGILPVIGNTQGGLTDIGQSFSATVHKRPSSYVEQYAAGVQYSLTSRDLFEVTYVGNHGLHMVISTINLNQLPPADLALGSAALTAQVANPFAGLAAAAGSACGLSGATVPAFQLMLPMPQFCDSVTNSKANVGFSNYNALNLKYTRRVTTGLTVLATYTYGKMLDDTFGSTAVGLDYTPVVRNNFDLRAEKSVDGEDIPTAAVISYIYELPYGRGKKFGSQISRPLDAVLGNWEISGISSFKKGNPIAIGGNLNAGSTFGGGQHANVVGDPNVAGPVAGNPTCAAPSKIRTVSAWFNPCAFTAAPAGTFGNAPRFFATLRNPGYNNTDLSISKWFNNDGRIRAQFRADMFNFVNHPNFGSLSSAGVTVGSTTAGALTQADIARQIQFALKIYW